MPEKVNSFFSHAFDNENVNASITANEDTLVIGV